MYSIGQVSEMFGIPVSTLRYYDKEGLFPNLERSGSTRRFGEGELELLRVIDCLKKTGLEIRDIKRFVDMVQERKELFEARKVQAEEEIERMQKALAMVKFKCWYYETAQKDGGEERLWEMIPDGLPKDIRKLYDLGHS